MTAVNPEEKPSRPKVTPPSAFLSRRQFIQVGMLAVGATWAGITVQNQLFPQQAAGQEAQPVRFPLADLPVGGVKAITYAGTPAVVLRTPESVRAFSLICTHLGCTVEWQANNNEFYCPCHDGRFDQFGEVTGGPPPVPLEQFAVRVENDEVIVGES